MAIDMDDFLSNRTPTTRTRKIPDLFDLQSNSSLTTWDTGKFDPNHTAIPGSKVTRKGGFVRAPSPNRPSGLQTTVSYTHDEWNAHRFSRGGLPGDVGGKFFSQRSYVMAVNPSAQKLSGWTLPEFGNPYVSFGEYTGPIYAIDPNSALVPVTRLDDLTQYGSTAIARCKPTNQIADLATFLAELRSDGLPKLFGATLWKERVNLANSVGEEYLNKEFGWDPLLGDVNSILYSLSHAHSVLQQYEHGSGGVTRRRYEFPIERTQTETFYALDPVAIQPYDPMFIDASVPRASVYKITRTWKRRWFSGAFTYHLPSGYQSRNALVKYGTQARSLLGTDLTPEVLWNAAPWTWAVDWFSNAGDVISNLTDWAEDGLVLKYGYIMEHSFITDTYLLDGPPRYKTKGVHVSPVIACLETKRREAATPFGFGLSWSGFSPRQSAIAAALGLTRALR